MRQCRSLTVSGAIQRVSTADTRNNYSTKRLNGHTGTVVELDAAGGTMLVERQKDGQRQRLDMRHLADPHVRPGFASGKGADFCGSRLDAKVLIFAS